MLIRKLDATFSEEERRRYKVVRLDTHSDVPGLILSASVDSGLCMMQETTRDGNGNIVPDKPKEYNFGPNGLSIVGAGR